jgi:uncharacterized protein with GYD domain
VCSASEWEDIMKTRYTVALLLLGLVLLPTGEAIGQQAGTALHRYLVRAVLTAEGLKNLQKQPPTALKAGVAKFVESVGGKLEFWYFDYGAATAYSVIDYPDEVAAATAQLSTNAAGFARVTIRAAAHGRGAGQSCRKLAARPHSATAIVWGCHPEGQLA